MCGVGTHLRLVEQEMGNGEGGGEGSVSSFNEKTPPPLLVGAVVLLDTRFDLLK